MPEYSSQITISGISVDVWRKPVRTLRIVVHPPSGKVRISVPVHLDDETVRRHLLSRLDWIRRHLDGPQHREKRAQLQYQSGEILYLEGKAHRLKVMEESGINRVLIAEEGVIELQLKPGTPQWQRAALVQEWYRARLSVRAKPMLDRWQQTIGEPIREWGIKLMKSRWGSCNVKARRVWLNLELAAHPDDALEYVIVHELAHLLEPSHNHKFKALMDSFLPDWRERRKRMKGLD